MIIFNMRLVEIIKKYGVQLGSLKLLNEIGIDLKIVGTIPSFGPLIIISNHNGMPDTEIIFAATKRKDLYHTALSKYKDILKKLNLEIYKKIIPIYKYSFFQGFKSKTKELNQQSIQKAADFINKGNALNIFPQGSVGKSITESGWKSGIGYLFKKITNSNTKIVFAYIKGTKKTDLFRFIKSPLTNILFKKKKVQVTFSKPFFLNEFSIKSHQSGKEITKKIEEKYYQFQNNC